MSNWLIAERERRRWHRWAQKHLQSYRTFDVDEERQRVKALSEWHANYGAARCYQVEGHGSEAAIAAVLAVVRGACHSHLLVRVGQFEAPGLLAIACDDLTKVFEKAAETNESVSLVHPDGLEMLMVDLPDSRQETFFIARGRWEASLDGLMRLLPGGQAFRGN